MRKTAHILLVDDDAGNLLTLGALIEEDGYTLTEASSLAEAKTRLAGGAFDLVLTDYELGDGFGTELVEVISSLVPRPKILLSSGHHLINDQRTRELDGVIAKGSDYPLVRQAITRALGG